MQENFKSFHAILESVETVLTACIISRNGCDVAVLA